MHCCRPPELVYIFRMYTSRTRRGLAAAALVLATSAAGLGIAAPAHASTAAPAITATPAATAPTYATWLQDVAAVTDQAQAYVTQRAASGGKLAIVLDIDNTSLETYYTGGYPTPAVQSVLALTKDAHARGVDIFFVSARPEILDLTTRYNLENVGYSVAGLYTRSLSDLFTDLGTYKTAQRAKIEAGGYTIIANIGNSATDLVGGHAERTFKLPDYDGLLD